MLNFQRNKTCKHKKGRSRLIGRDEAAIRIQRFWREKKGIDILEVQEAIEGLESESSRYIENQNMDSRLSCRAKTTNGGNIQ